MANLKKFRQTILMATSLLIVIAFFLSWLSVNPDFDMFAASRDSYSGFHLVRGIQLAAPTVDLLGKTYNFELAAKLIYVGYLLWLVPILGVIAIVLSGLGNKKAKWFHLGQYAIMLLIVLVFAVAVNYNQDMRTLFKSMFRFGFGFYMSLLMSVLGIGTLVMTRSRR
ncbi:hypothetical protein ACR6HW_12460 [Fusibacter sp. JL298sf-3]